MILTSRLKLMPCGITHFEAMLRDEQELAALLGVQLDPDWLGFSAAKEAAKSGRNGRDRVFYEFIYICGS
jgi:hypothetical protein